MLTKKFRNPERVLSSQGAALNELVEEERQVIFWPRRDRAEQMDARSRWPAVIFEVDRFLSAPTPHITDEAIERLGTRQRRVQRKKTDPPAWPHGGRIW